MKTSLSKSFFLLSSLAFTLSATAQNQQSNLEQSFDQYLSKVHVGELIRDLASKPHHLGSPGGKEVADKVLNLFKSYGWDAEIETYEVLFPTPKERVLELVEPHLFKAILKEPAVEGDASADQEGQLPTYNAWGADGDVTAPLVFVNYGLPADYEALERLGIDVKGKIVIAKYGNSWRGIKPKVAYEHGAVGCLIYSDPMDDGYFQGDAYPKGPFKSEHTVQRGSVMDMVLYPGDPLTPGEGSRGNVKRLDRTKATTILKIPVLPISYHDAKPLLETLGGPVAPESWRGALPLTYRVGGEGNKVHLKIEHNWDMVPCYNVIAKIKGKSYPDQWVIRGNHHDAWNNGASDPVSGLASMLEEAKSIGELIKQGYRPERTLVYCAWDGEEPSLIGSTEWVEQHAEELSQKAVAYVNTDNNSRGFFGAAGSHALKQLVSDVAADVKDPKTGVSIGERSKARAISRTGSTRKQQELMDRKGYSLGALGTGSDYSAFLQHLGIPSLNYVFSGEGQGGEYHSVYDTYENYSRFKDPDFAYGVALAQAAGRTVLRLANAEVLPFRFSDLQETIREYVKEIRDLNEDLADQQTLLQIAVEGDYDRLASNPGIPYRKPKMKAEVETIDLTTLEKALDSLSSASTALEQYVESFKGSKRERIRLNEILFQAEKQLLLTDGLPRRPWYKHSIYAPGFYTGYGVKTLPGVREAVEEGQYDEAREQVAGAAEAINRLAVYLTNAMD